jgi:tetratricopeptide (TPR) repeat protein
MVKITNGKSHQDANFLWYLLMVMKKLFLTFFLILYSFSSLADGRCSEERKQWIEFYKKDFAQNFSKIEYADNPCFIEIISQEFNANAESLITSNQGNLNIWNNLDVTNDINWVPEYFELDAKDDYLYGAQYFASKKYDEAAIFLSDFLENNTDDKLLPKAQFLYAETFRFRDDYIEAAYQYLNGYEKYEDSEFTPINTIRLGEMFIKINYFEKGCEIINNVQNEEPKVSDDIYLEAENLIKQYGCPKIVNTDSDIKLTNIIRDSKNLLK